MATEKKTSKKELLAGKKKKGGPNFLKLGKYFLLLLIVLVQGFLAFMIVDKYYPSVYATLYAKSPSDYVIYKLEDIVVNPANTYGKRYLMVEISLELDEKAHITLIEQNSMKIKQALIEALSSRTVPELTHVERREKMRNELITLINSIIGVRSVRNLYFTKYVMQ